MAIAGCRWRIEGTKGTQRTKETRFGITGHFLFLALAGVSKRYTRHFRSTGRASGEVDFRPKRMLVAANRRGDEGASVRRDPSNRTDGS